MRRLLLVSTIAAAALSACEDPTGLAFSSVPDTVLLYSLSRPGHFGFPSAFDMLAERRVVVEDGSETGNWDFALVESDSGFRLLLPGGISGLDPSSSIARVTDTPFEAIREAPSEGYDSVGVNMRSSEVYVLRTREGYDVYGNWCRFYAKLEPIDLDAGTGTVTFHYIANPNCHARSLVPDQ